MRKALIYCVAIFVGTMSLVPAHAAAQSSKKKYEEIDVTDGGTIRGRVVFNGEVPELTLLVTQDQSVCRHTDGKTKSPRLKIGGGNGVAETLVYLKNIERGKPLSALDGPATLDQVGCAYDPFLQVIPFKTRLTLINSDHLNHNVHARMKDQRDPFNFAMPNGAWPEKQTITTKPMYRAGLLKVGCDVHLWMTSYIWIVKHPYYAVTDEAGNFELTDVPPGDYELALWHPAWKATLKRTAQGKIAGYDYPPPVEQMVNVTVSPGEATEANFTLVP